LWQRKLSVVFVRFSCAASIVEQKIFCFTTILIFTWTKKILNFLTYDKFYVYFRNGRKVISYRLCRGLLSRRLYGYDGRMAFFFYPLSQFDKKWRFGSFFRFDYFYCRSTLFLHERLWAGFGESPTFFPLCWLLLTVANNVLSFNIGCRGAKQSLLWKWLFYLLWC
jgi:hypothetical protein